MARHASTYRQARREVFAAIRRAGSDMTWEEANAKMKEGALERFGPVRSDYIGVPPARSKYMPHIGAKQRAKAIPS